MYSSILGNRLLSSNKKLQSILVSRVLKHVYIYTLTLLESPTSNQRRYQENTVNMISMQFQIRNGKPERCEFTARTSKQRIEKSNRSVFMCSAKFINAENKKHGTRGPVRYLQARANRRDQHNALRRAASSPAREHRSVMA